MNLSILSFKAVLSIGYVFALEFVILYVPFNFFSKIFDNILINLNCCTVFKFIKKMLILL